MEGETEEVGAERPMSIGYCFTCGKDVECKSDGYNQGMGSVLYRCPNCKKVNLEVTNNFDEQLVMKRRKAKGRR